MALPDQSIIEAAMNKLADVVRKYLEGAGSVSPTEPRYPSAA